MEAIFTKHSPRFVFVSAKHGRIISIVAPSLEKNGKGVKGGGKCAHCQIKLPKCQWFQNRPINGNWCNISKQTYIMLAFSGAKLKYGTNDHGVMLFPTAWQVSKLKSPQSVDEVVFQHHAVCRVPNFEPFPCTSKAKIDTWQNPSWEIVETGSQTMPIFL